MSFTLPSLLASIAAGQGLFMALVLFLKKENRVPNRFLAAFLFVLAFALFQWILWWTKLIVEWPGFMGTGFCIPLLYGPLMYLFYQSTFEKTILKAKDLLHFLPALLAICLMLPFYLRFFENLQPLVSWIPMLGREPWFPVLIFAQMIAYGVWIGMHFSRYFLDNAELRRWHRWILTAYWGIVAAYLLYRLLSVFDLRGSGWIYLIAGSLCVFIYLIAWLGYIEPKVFAGLPLGMAANPVKYKNSSLTEENSKALFAKIKALMENEKIYQRDDFSLNLLAEHLGEQRYHISQSVNEHSGMTFPQYVSTFRVGDAKRLLSEKSKREMNVSEVAFAVGFNTKKAFNLAFKSKTGMTPTEYRQQWMERKA